MLLLAALLIGPFFTAQLQAQDEVRVMCYNILRYGAQGISCTPTSVTQRNLWIDTIMDEARPDIFGVCEIGPFDSPTAPWVNLHNRLKLIDPAYTETQITFNGNQDIANMMYYNGDKLGLAEQRVIAASQRNIDYYKFYYKGPGLPDGDTTFIEVVMLHLSADNATTRSGQTNLVMNFFDNLNRTGNFIVMGDMNMDSGNETAFQNMIAHPNLDIRLRDPVGSTGTWHNNNNVRHLWTQSTRNSGSGDCGAGGGLDDRFDLILLSDDIMSQNGGVGYMPSSHWVFGNPHAPNPAVTTGSQAWLPAMSDHYPVIVDLEIDRAVSRDQALEPEVELNIVQNPVRDVLALELQAGTLNTQDFQLDLYDLRGQRLRSWQIDARQQRHMLPLDGLSQGLYLLNLESEGRSVATGKVVVSGE